MHTYEPLGRIIIEYLYDTLWVNNEKISYDQFKRKLNWFITDTQSPYINKEFAKYNYNNENGKPKKPYKYRWENVMRFYINQQVEANLLQIKKNNGNYGEDFIFMAPKNTIHISGRHIFFDLARRIIKQNYEQQRKTR